MKHFTKALIFFGFVILIFNACQKKTNCQANITCNDAQGKPISDVQVNLFAKVKTTGTLTEVADVKATGVTDHNGKVSFVFKLPAIFDISAAVGTNSATAIVKLEEGKTTEKLVEFQ